jgi:hypothetical protein
MAIYRVVRTDKPQDLIPPAAADMTETKLGEKTPKNYTDNVFIKQHCQLRKASSSANHWKPGQQERIFLN